MFDKYKPIAEQYDIDLEKLKEEKGELNEEIIQKYIMENYYPKIKEEKKITGIRKIISKRLHQSYSQAIHVTINMEVIMDKLFELRNKIDNKPSLTVIMLKLLSQALKEMPELNSTFDGEKITTYETINIAVATDTPNGLITPVLREVDKKDINTFTREYEEVIQKARSGELKEKDLVGATFTVTNLGMFGVTSFTPIINPPQVAILGINTIKTVLLLEENLQKRVKLGTLSLTVDHRVIDGALGARFLQLVKNYFETSEKIV